jgi:hypothetical protein
MSREYETMKCVIRLNERNVAMFMGLYTETVKVVDSLL